MSNVIISPDGIVSTPLETVAKYSHYQFLRISSTCVKGKIISAQLQGYNGKKWVRAKAKPQERKNQ